ncbi:HAMP domain-containing sensor histidine kinase [Iamia majanohamensis]|uniref:histidine kinase n=1 Tax=Iamia majanohamensis TaxID=467976 RepID=A0AAF0BV28_9ACTN|nr:HAMP domain-containing sensor histidine kinase [Iamia majanohamensis]WCO65994.1 HAMP domain-containing sensor histidine kinase [Iamia majanohamensis]
MSLRLRLLLGLGLVAVVLVAVAAVVTTSTRADLVGKVDEQLRTVSRPRLGGPERAPALPALQRSTVWFGEVDDGEVVTRVAPRTPAGEPATPVLSTEDLARLDGRPGEAITVDGDGATRFRVMALDGPTAGVDLVGAPLDDVDSATRRLLVVEGVATLAVLALLALVAFWVLRLGVRPVQQMAAAAGAIAQGDLSRRVPEADPRTEAGELGAALNSMLAHIEEAFRQRAASEERLRRFVADASHELRTPITTIRGYAELHRRGGLEDPDDRRAAMERTEQEAVRMGVLVDDLLLLARLDQGRPLGQAPVALDALLHDLVADAGVSHAEHPVALRIDPGAAPAEVVGDDHRLRQVVANLVGNAVAHTPPGTTVAVALEPDPDDGSRLLLSVTDDGPGMDPDLAGRAFERFARGDVARSRAAGSTGLGLSIVAAIVAAHDGTVDLRTAPGAGTSVRVSLPRAGGAAPSPPPPPDAGG